MQPFVIPKAFNNIAPSENPKLDTLLHELGVSTVPSTKQFRQWLGETFPNWRFSDSFTEALPAEWRLIEKEGWELCYLAPESTIIETSARTPSTTLLPIGALMNGTPLVIDTLDDQLMRIGRVSQHRAMSGDRAELDRAAYAPFPLSYAEWLRHLALHPEDNRYL